MSVKLKKKIMSLKSPLNWYTVELIQRFEICGAKQKKNKKYIVWENLMLVKAKSIQEAYDKAYQYGEKTNLRDWETEYKGHKGSWVFSGISAIAPVYEKFDDLAEIKWTEYMNVPMQEITSSILNKKDMLKQLKKRE